MTESVQWALVIPVVLAILLAAVQVATWAHGRHTVRHAAAAAAEAASVSRGSPERDARSAATSVAGAGGLHSVEVLVTTRPDRVEVVTRARVDLIVDLGLSTVTARAEAPRERVS
ncbi:TadE family protein [Auraticoccus monumenti]|uniref:TadE family protein n=1 Tax=Auraticoccus monumenti TaxID=675864 RepID=UPI0012FA16B2|nr:TadE family protein [Auraticoccus monumenti]